MDFERLAAWMDDHGLPGKGEPIEHRFLSGGTQNEIYEIRRGDELCVIRIPPTGAPADRDRGILREWRIIEALDGTDVPHTPAVAMCEGPAAGLALIEAILAAGELEDYALAHSARAEAQTQLEQQQRIAAQMQLVEREQADLEKKTKEVQTPRTITTI